jgi:hypothetical protein
MKDRVGLDRMNITVDVNVGEGVYVLSGVGVGVSVNVDVGSTAAVCEAAAFAVCAMNRLMTFGSAVGNGVATAGTHAMTSTTATNPIKIFLIRFDIFPLPHPNR